MGIADSHYNSILLLVLSETGFVAVVLFAAVLAGEALGVSLIVVAAGFEVEVGVIAVDEASMLSRTIRVTINALINFSY